MTRVLTGAMADLILGSGCPGCGLASIGLCRPCREELMATAPLSVERTLPGFPEPVIAAGSYGGALRSLIIAAKERQRWGLLPILGELAARAVAAVLLESWPSDPVLVPVPSAPAAVRARGLDFTGWLARAAVRNLSSRGIPVRSVTALGQVRGVVDQVGLGRQQRLANLEGALVVRRDVTADVVLIDDLVTTGATLASAARTLRTAGAVSVAAAAVAQTPGRGHSR